MDVEILGLAFTVITAAIALGVQRRWDMRLMNRRFDDVNKRFEDLHRHFDKRFADVDKRFEDMHRHFDKRFADVDKRFDAVDKRIDAVERQQRESSVALVGMGKDVAQLAGRVDELTGLVSSAFQAVIGVVIARSDRKDRGSSVAQQGPFREPGPSED